MAERKSRRKETLQQKVDRLNGYNVNEHDYFFDRLFNPLKKAVAATGKELVCRSGKYGIEAKPTKDAAALPDWLDAILQA